MARCLCYKPSSKARLALLVCNIILVLAGMGCLAGGIVLSLGQEAYGESLDWMRERVVTEAEKAGVTNLDASALDLKFVTGPVGSAFLAIGSIVLLLAVLGIVASCGRFKIVLYIYVALTSIFMIGTSIAVLVAYSDSSAFAKPVKKRMKETLADFTGIIGTDATTLGWNAVMLHFNCCGVDNYEDFSVSANWERKTTFGFKLITPVACCETTKIKDPPQCARRSKYETRTFYDRGCYEPLFRYVRTETGVILFVTYFLLFMEFICLFLSVTVTCVMVSKSPDEMRVMDFMY